jgi:hypothetical protein
MLDLWGNGQNISLQTVILIFITPILLVFFPFSLGKGGVFFHLVINYFVTTGEIPVIVHFGSKIFNSH